MKPRMLLIAEARIATVQLLEHTLAHLEPLAQIPVRSIAESDVTADDFSAGTIPVLVRSASPRAVRLARTLKTYGVPYIYYIDDNFWLLDPSTPIGRQYRSRRVRESLEFVVRSAALVVASTPLLQEYVSHFNPRTVQLDVAHHLDIEPAVPVEPARTDRIRFGFAASAHRGVDLDPLVPTILTMLDSDVRLEFEVIGADLRLPQHPRISVWGYRESRDDYVQLQKSRRWDFAIAPLGAAQSNLYKTDVKFREYAAHGIPGVYEDAPPYATVTHGHTGLLAGAHLPWADAIAMYISDPGLRASVRTAARLYVQEHYEATAVAQKWLAAIAEFPIGSIDSDNEAAFRAQLEAAPSRCSATATRLRTLWQYGLAELRVHGLWPTVGRTIRFMARKVRRGWK